jgi:very-short-patch-repair endonuclease
MAARSKVNRKFQALLAERASALRAQGTISELRLWQELRSLKLGVAFRRQAPVGRAYIADFLAPALFLIVEVDGGYHQRRAAADARKDRAHARLGYRVLRLDAELVMSHLPVALARIREAISEAMVVAPLER